MSKASKNGAKRAAKSAGAVERAAIYVRVSSEKQAKTKGADGQEAEAKESPQAQERDCRALAERQGYVVVKVYRDTEKYRVGGKMVEPSGTRADRPGLRAMLADARKGDFDVILAWREDRLYRGSRPMLDVLDCLEETGLDIELAKEHFDKKMAPVKAWVAKMELDAKADRTAMGLQGRLAAGKAWPACIPYGYIKVGDALEANLDESKWVTNIWGWYADSVPVPDIRQHLITGGAPQRFHKDGPQGPTWKRAIIYRILSYDFYHTGLQRIKWDGKTFDISIPVLVDAATAQRVAERKAREKAHPARNLKFDYLGLGLVYCACGTKMRAKMITRVNGNPRQTLIGQYHCLYYAQGCKVNCVHLANSKKIDAMIWEKVWALLSDDQLFERMIQAKVEALRAEEDSAGADVDRGQRELDDLEMERQRVITWARKGTISEDDLGTQLAALTFQEAVLRRELSERSLLIGDRAQRLMDFAAKYRRELSAGAEWLNTEPQTPEEAHRQFEYRREIVETIVRRVDVLLDKTIKVYFELDLSGGAEISEQLSGQVW